MGEKTKRVIRTLSDDDRQEYANIRRQLETERAEIVAEGRRRKRVRDAITAELHHAFRLLKKERIAQGLSLADMQDRTGMSRSAISRLENDETANPTIETLSRYAEVLGKEVSFVKRTNVYLHEEQLRELKHIAVEEGLSFTELVRRALSALVESYRKEGVPPWEGRLDTLVAQVRERGARNGSKETEEGITAASAEVQGRQKKTARRR